MKQRGLIALIASFCLLPLLRAQNFSDLIQFEAEKYSTNLETQKTEVEGHVKLKLGDRELFADKLVIDPNSGDVECSGKVLFKQGPLEIEAKGVKFNMKSGLGVFYDAIVKRAGAFQLEGREIKRESEQVYEAKIAKISFCQDCPPSWSLTGDRIRVNTERYAEIHHALIAVKDIPVFYLPVVYYPAQDKRFTGFLIPYFKFSTALGAQIGIPFYYAPTDYMDFTYDYRYMSRGGHRNALESRYRFSDYSFLTSNTSWIRTPSESQWFQDRYGIHYGGRFQLFKNWAFLARGDFISDVEMSQNFEDDSPESRLPTLSNDLFLESQYENFSLFAGVRMPQDNLDRVIDSRGNASWTLPHIKAGTPYISLFENTLLGATRIEMLSVRRLENGDFSNALATDPNSGFIASGDRYSGLVDLSLPLSLDYIRSVSSVHYRGDYYKFPSKIDSDTATRSRFVFQQSLEGDLSRIWDVDFDGLPRIKHVLTPFVEYSYAPEDLRSGHDFFKDCPNGVCSSTATRFDVHDGGLEDIRLGTEESEKRLREHHLLNYGFKTQLLGKFSAANEIREVLYLKVAHEYDLITKEPGKILVNMQGYLYNFQLSSQISWDYETADLDMQNDILWNEKYFAFVLYQSIRPDIDNVGGEIRLKKLGPFELATSQNYDRREQQLLEQKYFLSYLSASKCWRFDLGLRRRLGDNDFEYSPSIQVLYSESIKKRDDILKSTPES
ncbi:MAG: putative LPS assembly protein LptD [Bdellovibrionota bacterium]